MADAILAADGVIAEQRPTRTGLGMPGAMSAPAGFLKNTTQSACAGLLTLAGATQLTSAAAAADGFSAFTGGSIEPLAARLVAGDLTGVLQVLGAIALFLTAGRGLARVLGLLVFVAAATAYFNGVGATEIINRSQDIFRALGPAYETFQASLMSVE